MKPAIRPHDGTVTDMEREIRESRAVLELFDRRSLAALVELVRVGRIDRANLLPSVPVDDEVKP